jgi:regulator of cell morphogenesis and NO signaling
MTRNDQTLGDLVAANASAARVLDALGLDFCCHGDRTLAEACATAGIDADVVARRLDDLDVGGDTAWTSLDAPSLAAHIVETHHRYLHEELPLLDALADKVLSVHGERHPELNDVRRLVSEVSADLEPHLMKEERVLFPAIAALADGRSDFAFGPIANPISMMGIEHDRAGDLLAELRAVTRGHVVPDDACASYRSLYERLAALEADTHLHIHKENHVLFPAALRLADALVGSSARRPTG